MKLRRLISAALVLLLCINVLAGCGISPFGTKSGNADGVMDYTVVVENPVTVEAHDAASAPQATPEPTPEPTPPPTHITLTASCTAEDILALAEQTQLESIDACDSGEYEALIALKEMLPGCDISWRYPLGEESYDSSVSELSLTGTEGLFEALRYLPAVTKVDLTACSPEFEEMDALIAAYPNVDFIWNVSFSGFTVRSDITVFSTLCMPDRPTYTSEMLEPLFKYCKHLKALDLGHNLLTDLSMLGTLSELQVLIIGDNRQITDISPLGNLKNLEYLECFTLGDVSDFSCFSELTKMKALNCSNMKKLDSIEFIENMPELETLWIYWFNTDLREQINSKIEQHPEIKIKPFCSYGSYDSVTCCGWRMTDMNCAIRKAFANWENVIEYVHWDDVTYKEGVYIYPAGPWSEH